MENLDPGPCPDYSTLGAFASGAASASRRGALDRHLSLCESCADAVAWAAGLEDRGAGISPAAAPRVRFGIRRGGAIAAAAILIAIGGGAFWTSARPEKGVYFCGPGRLRSIQGVLNLPDGSWLKVEDGAEVRLHPSFPGERVHLSLERGALETRVAKGSGAFHVVTPAGEIQVLGTRFRVSALRFRGDAAPEDLRLGEATCVEVYEGRVSLRNAGGEIVLPATVRGVSFPGSAPFKQERGGTWESALQQFARIQSWQGDVPAIPADRRTDALLLAAAFWGGGDHEPAAPWLERLQGISPPDLRAAAAIWLGLGNPKGAKAALERLRAVETDPRVQTALRKALACIEGAEADPR